MHIARRKGQSIDRPGVRAWGAGVGSEKNPSVAVMHHIIARYALLIDISAEYSRHREAGQREVQPWAQSEWPRLRYNNNEKVSPILTTQSTARPGGKLHVEYGAFVSLENSFDQDMRSLCAGFKVVLWAIRYIETHLEPGHLPGVGLWPCAG